MPPRAAGQDTYLEKEAQTWTPKSDVANITVAVLMKRPSKGHPYRGPGHKRTLWIPSN